MSYQLAHELTACEATARDVALVIARTATDNGSRTSLDEVLTAFGHTREDLDALADVD